MRFASCVRSGACCKKAPCALAVAPGATRQTHSNQPCPNLVGDKPGGYACQLILDNPKLGSAVAIGGGCGMTMFNPARQEAGAPKPRLEVWMTGQSRSKS